MSSAETLLGVVHRLYAGLTRTPPWEDFLRALADATGATFTTLLVGRSQAGIEAHVTPGIDPDRAREYRHLSDQDPFVGLPEGRVVSFRDFVRHIPSRFRDWMDIARTGQILGVDLQREPDIYVRLRVTRDHSRPDFDEADAAFIERLIPHLRVALDLHARLTTTQAESQLFGSAMADLAVATLILDRQGRILRRNAMADRMIEEGAIVAERSGKLAPPAQRSAMAIQRLLAAPPPIGEEYHVELAMPGGGICQAKARSVPSGAYGDGARLALFLADPHRASGPSADVLRDRFQFTRSEALLAVQLASGTSLADAAGALDIAYNTARSHLRGIFAKTGTHRQVELVTLLRAADATGAV
jgi:DNA-binding CsgD family transcriptional regulator/PAS domain-containing protein